MVRGWLYGELKLYGLLALGPVPTPVLPVPRPAPPAVPPLVPFPPVPPVDPVPPVLPRPPAPPVPPVLPRPPPAPPAPPGPPPPPGRCGSGSAEVEKDASISCGLPVRGFSGFDVSWVPLFATSLAPSPGFRRALP